MFNEKKTINTIKLLASDALGIAIDFIHPLLYLIDRDRIVHKQPLIIGDSFLYTRSSPGIVSPCVTLLANEINDNSSLWGKSFTPITLNSITKVLMVDDPFVINLSNDEIKTIKNVVSEYSNYSLDELFEIIKAFNEYDIDDTLTFTPMNIYKTIYEIHGGYLPDEEFDRILGK